MMNTKYSMIFSFAILAAGIAGEVKAASCDATINDLRAWVDAYYLNTVEYQMTVMNNNHFVGYSKGDLWLKTKMVGPKNNKRKVSLYLYKNSAEMFLSDRILDVELCKQEPPYIMPQQPFNYTKTQKFGLKLYGSTLILNLDKTYNIPVSCQNGYIYGFVPDTFMVTIYPKKSRGQAPPR
jgi:hypothetical protein